MFLYMESDIRDTYTNSIIKDVFLKHTMNVVQETLTSLQTFFIHLLMSGVGLDLTEKKSLNERKKDFFLFASASLLSCS